MRNQRAAAYARAAARAAEVPAGTRWSTLTADPNDPIAIALRARVLRDAFRPPVTDRIGYLTERCRGRTVLDIGAVAHAAERVDSPTWLHGRLAAVAASCLAVDILPEGVAAMRQRGYDAIVHDLTAGAGPLRERGPFEVVVAGELIEHVTDLGMLFRTAAELLAPDGEMLLTTPNPFAPQRVWAGRRGIAWENVDHILLAFPTGIAELAEGIPDKRIVVTGNTVVGAVTEVLRGTSASAAARLTQLGLAADSYVVSTIHRPENTDDPGRPAAVLGCLGEVAARMPVLLPLHPRTRSRIDAFGLGDLLQPLTILEPLAYDDFVALCARAAFAISDSGGIQEEASVWRRPVLVVRRSTERPEVIGTVAQRCEPGPELTRRALDLVAGAAANIARLADVESPYGDEFVADRCVAAIDRLLSVR